MASEINDTITAISTPIGFGGIGVVRISGPRALKIARSIFRSKYPQKEKFPHPESSTSEKNTFISRKIYHGYIVTPDSNAVIDEVLLAPMTAPKSYTMEDVVEIQAHAGPVVLKKIVELVVGQGARLAEAGEFTRRAYMNGRLDLSQAEAVIDIIQAKTESALKLATRHMDGSVVRTVNRIKDRVLEAQAMIEADIEFPEEMDEGDVDWETCQRLLLKTVSELDDVLKGYQKGHLLRDGLRLAILGKVNVGKSSLMNRFLRKERAIVTEIPGTTRDHIEETLDVSGLPVILIDTAGWRDTTDPVEKIGIERTRDLAKTADLVLFMVDAERGILAEDHEIYRQIQEAEKILVINKTDLVKGNDTTEIPEGWYFKSVVYISVKEDAGIETLLNKVYEFGTEGWEGGESGIVPNLRQKKLFEMARKAVGDVLKDVGEGISPELAVLDLRDAVGALDEITGNTAKTDVLDMVFSRFCIGK